MLNKSYVVKKSLDKLWKTFCLLNQRLILLGAFSDCMHGSSGLESVLGVLCIALKSRTIKVFLKINDQHRLMGTSIW